MNRQRSNFKRMQLTPKQTDLLRELEAHGYRSCEEIRVGVLKSLERTSAWRAMQRLVKAKLVRRVLDSKGKLIGWSPRGKASWWMSENAPPGRIERGKIPKISDSHYHDQEVRWILDQVGRLPSTKRVLTESKIKEDLFRYTRATSKREINRLLSMIPDGRFSIQNGSHDYEIAIELELTQKTHARTQAKLEHYIANTNYDIVIYVCGSEGIFSALWRNYEIVLKNSPAAIFADRPAQIYFVLHSDLKKDFAKAKIRSVSDEFTFGATVV